MLTPELINEFRYKLRFRKRFSQEEEPPLVIKKLQPLPNKETISIDDVIKSQQDPKNYRGLILPNGIKVTLISDPTTSKSAACLAFETGKMNDPDDIPGLAHLCEHAMFLGSEKFPADNDFRLFISENGGFTNAQTFSDVTKYFFDIVPEKLDDALDRFSQMFLAPLFNSEAILREIQAVDNEHEMNLSSDTWRVRMVNKKVALKDHPYNKFGTGNKKTLNRYGLDIRKELIEFHKKYYKSGNLINFCLMGREPLDKLQEIANKYFNVESIVDGKTELPVYSDQIFPVEEMMTKLFIVPLHDVRTMTLSFQTTCLLAYFKSKPQQYLVNLISNESHGSILSELRRRRWSTSLNCDHVKYANGFGFFEIKVDLTDEGYAHMDDIIHLIFQYLKLIRVSGIQKWIYDEQSRLSEIEFAFEDERNPISLVSKVASCMRHYPMREVLSGGVLMEDFNPDLIKFVLDMLKIENMRIIIVDQGCYYKCKLVEEIYGTKYGYERISGSKLNLWRFCGLDDKLKIPEKNLFIPENFDFHAIENWKQTHPKIIRDTSVIRVWFKQDTEYRKPKTILSIELKNVTVNCDPLNWNLTQIFAWMLEDHLKERLYSAVIAGTDWNFSVTTAGIRIFIEGFSEKMEIFVETILNEIYKFKINLQKFEDAFDEYYADLKGFEGERAQQIGIYYLELILNEQMWSNEELIKAMKVISICRMKTFVKEVLTQAYGECFVFGNVDEERALKLSAIVENRLNKARSSNKSIILIPNIPRERKLENSTHNTLLISTEYDKINSINLLVHCGLQDDKSNVLLDLIHQILRAEFFDTLRTKEQQGYVVDCILRRSNGTQGIKFVVESMKKPEYIEGRIMKFMMSMAFSLSEMSQEKFDNHKKSLKLKKLQTPLTLAHQFWRYHHEIANQTYHFNRHQVEASILRDLKQKEVIEFYESHIATRMTVHTPNSSLLAIHIVAEKCAKTSMPTNPIENLMDYKTALELNPRPARFKNLRKFYSKKI